MQLLRINDRVLSEAGRIQAAELRSLDLIHLASARQLGASVRQVLAYDDRMAEAARTLGWSVIAPS
jgi:predicted nucleic acid-binding protein